MAHLNMIDDKLIFKISVVCFWLLTIVVTRPPPSPCPEVFEYETDFERDRWYGNISFRSNIELAGLNIKLLLDRPAQLLACWEGEARTKDNKFFSIFNPYTIQQAGETVRVKIMVKFDPSKGAPVIQNIVIDGNTICQGGTSFLGPSGGRTSSTERYDPVFTSQTENIVDEFLDRDSPTSNDEGSSSETRRGNADKARRPTWQDNTVIPPSQGGGTGGMNFTPLAYNPNGGAPFWNQLQGQQTKLHQQQQTQLTNFNNVLQSRPSVMTVNVPNQDADVEQILQLVKAQLEQRGTVPRDDTRFPQYYNPYANYYWFGANRG